MKGESKSWKRYSSCVTINHCLLTFLIVISTVNYSHAFWPLWSNSKGRVSKDHQESSKEYPKEDVTTMTKQELFWITETSTATPPTEVLNYSEPIYTTPKTPEDNLQRIDDVTARNYEPVWSSVENDVRPTVNCDAREFSCHSRRLCIKPHLVCDGINDCDDGSDEVSCTTIDPASDCSNGKCPLSYERDPSPPRCDNDYSNISCKYHKRNVPLVVFSTLYTLYETSLPEDRAKIHLNKTLNFDLVGINAFDYENFVDTVDTIIWLDKGENKIFHGFFVQSLGMISSRVTIEGTHKIHGFVYDWMNYTLIWIDDYGIRWKDFYKKDQPKLYRTLDPSYDRPGSITIDVKKQCVFWTNIGANPYRPFGFPKYIERIDIRSEFKTEKIVETNILCPVGLAIDTKNTKVYWIDGLYGTLESVGYDGTNRIILYESLPFMYELISMNIFSNYLYFTDLANSTIQRININNAIKKVDTLISVPNGPPTCVEIIDPRVQFSTFLPI